MNLSNTSGRRATALLATMLAGSSLFGAADDASPKAAAPVSAAATSSQNEEIAQLRAALAVQQKQLEVLQHAMEQQQKLLEHTSDAVTAQQALRPNLGNVASLTPVVPAAPVAALAIPNMPMQKTSTGGTGNPCEAAPDSNAVPPYLRIGNTCVIPVGFMDLTGVWRDKNAGSGIGSNFSGVPYNNVTAGKLSEFRFSPQNSRLGFRADGDWKGTHFIAYNEFDFLGTSGGNNLGVTNGAFVPRIRLFWVDVRKGQWEFLGGQSWSMLTPNRKGISALPSDLFYSQVVDVNYMAGLTWTRQPGVRVLYHPSNAVTFGVSFENPDQQIGGSGGLNAGVVTLPAASSLSGLGGTQVDNSSNVLNTPNLHPDIIAKVAFDPSSKFHFELGGIERTFKIYNSATTSYSTKAGGGVLVGGNVEVVKNLRLISTNFWSDGGGRYLFGQAPDFIVRANGAISPVRAGGTVDGFEATVNKFLLYAYYGGIYVGRNTALDANGTTRIGYGQFGASPNDNKAINELSFGFNETMWKNPRYGAINLMGQYEWLSRDPWFTAVGAPKGTHDNTIFVNLRYTLPGSMPNF